MWALIALTEIHGASPLAPSMTSVRPRRIFSSPPLNPPADVCWPPVAGENVVELFDVVQGEMGWNRKLGGLRSLTLVAAEGGDGFEL